MATNNRDAVSNASVIASRESSTGKAFSAGILGSPFPEPSVSLPHRRKDYGAVSLAKPEYSIRRLFPMYTVSCTVDDDAVQRQPFLALTVFSSAFHPFRTPRSYR
jgi:hypothetical protein